MQPKVTIMIPTYNQEEYIAEAIESALSQDYPNLEVIVTDDCSKDRTGEIAKRYTTDPRFRYILNETNLGRVGNYHNTLYTHATGEWVINLDGDDYFTDDQFISRSMQRILSQNNIVCYFATPYMRPKVRKYASRIQHNCYLFNGKDFFLRFFTLGNFMHAGAIYNRKIALKDSLCYTYDGIQSDFHGIIRYCLLGNIIFAKDDWFHWRIHNNNATTSISNITKYELEIKCQQQIISDIPHNILNSLEISNWLKTGQKAAMNQYVIDCLCLTPSISSLVLGLKHFRFFVPYIIIYCKSILNCLGIKVRF